MRKRTVRTRAAVVLAMAAVLVATPALADDVETPTIPPGGGGSPSDYNIVYGGDNDIASGTWGECNWSIDANGLLRVTPINGVSGRLADSRGGGEHGFPWIEYRNLIRRARFDGGVVLPGVCSGMFYGCSSLVSLDVSGWDTSSVTDMRAMFNACSSLSCLDVSGWDTSSVTEMGYMFGDCSSLSSLDVSGWDTSNVKSMFDMFYNCSSLSSLDVSSWDTSSVWDMFDVFFGCSSLKTLDVSGWDISSALYLNHLFFGCSSLKSLDLSGWDTSNVMSMPDMFNGCSSLWRVTIGAQTDVLGELVSALPNTRWRSAADGGVYDASQLAGRAGIADTYTRIKGSVSGATVSAIAPQTYTGAVIKPAPKVTLGGAALREGADYTLSWSNNVNVGTATVTVTGAGVYEGSTSVTFSIAKAKNGMKIRKSTKKVKASKVAKKKQAVMPLKVTGANGKVTYKRVAKGSSKRLSVNKKNGKVTVKKGTKAGTYKIRIKVTAKGDANHKKATKTVTVTVRVK